MNFKNIFTEYNENIEKSIDVDPLGFGAIWTYFGQQIFENKISSATFDIRNFNINLFNHYVVKTLSMKNERIKDKILQNKKETIEKLLIVLENMVIYSWYINQSKWGERKGLLGSSKAISKWKSEIKKNNSFDINKNFQDLELLKNQKITGVNGTYKGSFIAMFNKNKVNNENLTKDYDIYFDDDDFCVEIEKLISRNKNLNELFNKVITLFESDKINIEKIPKKNYIKVFSKHKKISKYTQKFWLKYLGFENKEAQLIYNIIDFESEAYTVIKGANNKKNSIKFENIISLEPNLNYYENLFYYLLQKDGVSTKEIEDKDCIKFDIFFKSELKNTIKDSVTNERLKKLSNVESINDFIEYHKYIMKERSEDKLPWIDIEDNKIKVTNINANTDLIEDEELMDIYNSKIWGNRYYYVYTVASIKKGFISENI